MPIRRAGVMLEVKGGSLVRELEVLHSESRWPTPTILLRMANGRNHSRRGTMLELRPNCECCDRDLPPDSPDARICSFECTFCRECAEGVLGGRCPNCTGELLRRPIRPTDRLLRHPASTRRVFKPEGCTRT